MSGNIAMGGNKITGLGAATASGQALRYEQLISLYLLLTGGTLSGDLTIGAQKIITTNHSIKQLDATWLGVRNAADDAVSNLKLGAISLADFLYVAVDAKGISPPNVNSNYFIFRARDNDSDLVEAARLVGAADPYFQATLPMVLNPSATPATIVEGHFFYGSTPDKLQFQNASALQTVASNLAGIFAVLGFGADSNLSNSATNYLAGGNGAPAGTETITQTCISPIAGTLKNLYVEFETAPTSGKSWTVTVRVNGADTSITCSVADTDVAGNDASNTAAVAVGDEVSISVVPVDSPTATTCKASVGIG